MDIEARAWARPGQRIEGLHYAAIVLTHPVTELPTLYVWRLTSHPSP